MALGADAIQHGVEMLDKDLETMDHDELLRQLVISIRELREQQGDNAVILARLDQKADSITLTLDETRRTVSEHADYISQQKGGARMLTALIGFMGGLIPWFYEHLVKGK